MSNHFGIIISADQPMADRPRASSTRTRTKACGAVATRADPKRKGKRNSTGRSKTSASASLTRGASVIAKASLDAVHGEHAPHARGRKLRIGEGPGLVRQAEKLGEMDERSGALLPSDHDEMVL